MPSSSKHHRRTSDSDANDGARAAKTPKGDFDANSRSGNSTSAATFWDLPLELRSIILDLACQRQWKPDGSLSNGRGPLQLDKKTIWSLSLVSRSFNATFHRILYSHVKLVTPGELADFRQALLIKPSNGMLVKSIHIGPLSDLPKGWWPFRCWHDQDSPPEEDEPIFVWKTSLSRRDPLRPRWCNPEQEWAYNQAARTCYGRAVDDTIGRALEGVGLGLDDPEDPGYQFTDGKGGHLGINQWTLRVYEVQAVLDLYLQHMRRVEDEEGRQVPSWRSKEFRPGPKAPRQCRMGSCGHYPRLVLEGFAGVTGEEAQTDGASSVQDGAESNNNDTDAAGTVEAPDAGHRPRLIITREQVTNHLHRRGARADHFDHPHLFARTNQRKLFVASRGRVVVNHARRGSEHLYPSNYDSEDFDSEIEELDRYNDDEYWTPSSSPTEGSTSSSPSLPSSASSPGFQSEATAAIERYDMVGLARSTLRLTPQVRNLSLTGYLYRPIRTNQPELGMLRCLSLGPLSPTGKVPSALTIMELQTVEKFRVCGNGIGLWAAGSIGREGGTWPVLREVQWDYGGMYQWASRDRTVEKLLEEMNLLQGRPRAGINRSNEDPGSTTAPTSDKPVAARPSSTRSKHCYIEVRLHPHHVAAMLKEASPEQRAAWISGSHVSDAPHRVRLAESQAAKGSAEEDEESQDQDLEVLRKGSMKWWEEEAWELERGELPNVSI